MEKVNRTLVDISRVIASKEVDDAYHSAILRPQIAFISKQVDLVTPIHALYVSSPEYLPILAPSEVVKS